MLLHTPPALKHRKFRLLLFGQLVSIAGTQMQVWAIFWHIRTLTDQPIALGGVGLARILPILLFALIGGALADARNRRGVMLITQSLMALYALGLALLSFSGGISLWQIYALTGLQAMAVAFDTPARQALTPNLVPARDLPNAFSLNSIAMHTGSIAGPALSGLVIAFLGQPYTYLFNAISYLAVILALIAMGPVEQQLVEAPASATGGPAARPVSWAAIRDGVQFILGQPIILSTMILDFFATFFSSANTLMPIFARDILKVGAVEYGWLSSAQAVGAVSAALVISQLQQIRRQGPLFLLCVGIFGLATIAFGLSTSFAMAFVALMFIGGADAVGTIIRNTIRQLQTPDHIRGRMTSINQVFFMGGPQLGEMEAGVVAQFLGAPFAVVSGGVGAILAMIWVAWRWPQLRTYNS